jgi:hypothetical protein
MSGDVMGSDVDDDGSIVQRSKRSAMLAATTTASPAIGRAG